MFQIGQILDDRYQLVEPLKLVGLRQTWRSIDLANQAVCVVKLLGFHSTLRWQDYEQFEREIKILKSLKQKFVPRYLSNFSLDWQGMHWFVLVQSLIPGATLQALIDQHYRFTESEIRQIGIDLLQVLIDLHGQHPPILHRRIEPDNIILTPDRSVYLINFSAAGTLAPADSEPGSDGYAPQEQFSGQAVPASDLYAVGATLVHLLTGICPADLPQDQHQLQFRSLVDIDDSFARWLDKMLEFNSSQRFQTAKQALANLLTPSLQSNSIAPISGAAQRSITHTKAVSDRIKAVSNFNQLQINIARRGVRFTDALWLGAGALTSSVAVMMLFSHVHPALSILCWLDSLPLFGIGLISALGEATLTLQTATSDSTTPDAATQKNASLSIQWRCLGIPYRRVRQSGTIQAIESAPAGITIQTEEQPYSVGQFSPPLSEVESESVVREVKGWMGGWVDGWMGEDVGR